MVSWCGPRSFDVAQDDTGRSMVEREALWGRGCGELGNERPGLVTEPCRTQQTRLAEYVPRETGLERTLFAPNKPQREQAVALAAGCTWVDLRGGGGLCAALDREDRVLERGLDVVDVVRGDQDRWDFRLLVDLFPTQ